MTNTHITAATAVLMAVAALTACGPGADSRQPRKTFIQEVRLTATPVKDQGRSPLCWVYAVLATIETEHAAQGDSVNLSPDYTARCRLAALARRCYLSRGHEAISLRGMCTTALHLLREQGAMPYDSYHQMQTVNYNALARRAMLAVRASRTLADADEAVAHVADNAIGSLPTHVYMFGAEYSPIDFAQSVCRHDEWHAVTSFTHHPFGKPFRLEVPDNLMDDMFMNVPIDSLVERMRHSLRRGHPVCWEGDISEPGFSWSRGIADIRPGTPVTQQHRQQEFESRRTTDDHCMAITGMARDAQGRRYFIAKNSWGTGNRYAGYMYLSEDYVRLKTIAVLLHD